MPQDVQQLEQTAANPEALIANLTKQWQHEEAGSAVNGAVVRASTTNLVIFSADDRAARQAGSVLPQVAAIHPCRAVHVHSVTPATAPLAASSRLHTCFEKGQRVITCEEVTLTAGHNTLEELEGAIAPLISPDLPVCLWWQGNPPFEGKLFGQLLRASDRVIYDSNWFLEAEEDLPWACELIKSNVSFNVAFSDVNWARLTPWRGLIAQFFDGAQQMQALAGIDRVTIEWTDDMVTEDRVSVAAWLAIGWLGSRLRWTSKQAAPTPSQGETRFTLLRADRQPVEVVLKRITAAGLHPGGNGAGDVTAEDGVTAVEIHSTLPVSGTYRVELGAEPNTARTISRLDGAQALERTVDLDVPPCAALIAAELDMPGRDEIYEEALNFCAPLPAPVEVASPS